MFAPFVVGSFLLWSCVWSYLLTLTCLLGPFFFFFFFFAQLPLEVTLDASNSSDVEGIVSLQWDCQGDGNFEATSDWTVATGRTHVCTYTKDGAYEATVQATNALVRTLSVYFVPGTWYR